MDHDEYEPGERQRQIAGWIEAIVSDAPGKDHAAEQLHAIIQQVTRRMSLGIRNQHRSDLEEQAPAEVILRLDKYDSAKGAFEPWCRSVVYHLFVDGLRKRARDVLGEAVNSTHHPHGPSLVEVQADPLAVDFRDRLENAWAWENPLSPVDLERIQSWPPRDRILLLTLPVPLGLWRKIPAETWQTHLAEAGLSENFPPDDWEEIATTGERIAVLAEVLGQTPESIKRQWYRLFKAGHLAELTYLKELAP